MKVVVSFSGGKDSQACLIWAVNKYGKNNVEAVFCDTGWEHPDTYTHIENTCNDIGIKLTILKGKYDFVGLAKYKKRFPSTKARFCTEELKIKPFIDWVLEQTDNLLIIQGIRSQESISRAEMDVECMYFKNYFEKLPNGKTYNYRKKEVFEWCKKYDASILRPIKEWTAQQVIDCILSADQHPNPLYYRGLSRVGCFPCIMARHSEMRELIKDDAMKNRLIDAEDQLYENSERGSSFFPPNYIPKYARDKRGYASINAVIKYISNKNNPDIFEPKDGYSCMSLFHGLCE